MTNKPTIFVQDESVYRHKQSEPERWMVFELQFNQIITRRYWSSRQQEMKVRIDIDSKTITGLGLAFSVEQAELLLRLLPTAIQSAHEFEMMDGATEEDA